MLLAHNQQSLLELEVSEVLFGDDQFEQVLGRLSDLCFPQLGDGAEPPGHGKLPRELCEENQTQMNHYSQYRPTCRTQQTEIPL